MEILYSEVFEDWLKRLRDQRAKAAILSRLRRVEEDNFGDHASVGGGVSELRVDVGQGYRVYYAVRQAAVVVLLCGGSKSSQRRDVKRAQLMAGEMRRET